MVVSGKLMLVLLAAVIVVKSRGQAPPDIGIYFTLNGTVYLPGDTVLITDIGSHTTDDIFGTQTSLLCITSNVNIGCCRSSDNFFGGGSRGDWYFPNGTRILSTRENNFYRIRYLQQIQLYRRNGAMSPTGVFTCEVPNDVDSTMPHTATITIAAVLNVMLTGSGGTITEGQNYVLTCEANGDRYMAYTYMWLKDGVIVSGQNSSTYSFSPLLVVHSGRYSCRVSDGSMTMTSEGVNITVERTATQLYFTWRGNRYEPGDSILITDIRVHHGDAGPGDSLVCVTTDVNTQCCTDVGGVGEWFLPNGNMVPRNIDDPNGNSQIIRTGRDNQVRLNFRTSQTSPTGEYTCVVPETGGVVNQTAGIRLVTVLPQLNVMLTGSGTPTEGQDYMLTCTASGGGSMAYTYMWLRNGSVVSGQTLSTYTFSPLRETDSGQYSCQVRVGSTIMNTSREVTITTVIRCSIGSYLTQTSPGNTVCRPCPNKSISTLPNSEVCECLQGYHRNPLEDIHVSCTRPPSACSNLRVYRKRTRANTITVRWERPLITGRDDYYYDIFYSDPELPGSFKKHNLNPFIKKYPLVTYSVSGLRPLTNYTIRVVSHNGVSDQDPEGEEERRCEVSETTGDIRAQPPRSVTSFCSVIVWKAPTRAYGVITGYEVSFSLPGGHNGVIVSKNRDEFFHAVKGNSLPRGEGDILIKVRAMTVSHNGTWSDAISLDCPGTDNGSACLGF